MKKLIFATLVLGLMGCDNKADFKGTATLSQNLSVNNVDNKPQTIAKGTYNTKVTVDGKGIAKVRLFQGNSDKDAARFLMNVRELQNSDYVPAAKLGQNYDLRAKITSGQSQSALQQRTQQCIYDTVYQQVCRPNQNGQIVCHWQPVGYRYGRQWITYYEIYSWDDLAGALYQPNSSTAVAQINGRSQNATQEVVTNASPCML